MARKSLSYQYASWIDMAAMALFAIVGALFVYMIIRYFQWKSVEGFQDTEVEVDEPDKIATITMMKNPKNVETWLNKNREAGIGHFYIRLEDSPDVLSYLTDQDDVTVNVGKSRGINEYEDIQHRQVKMVDECLVKAQTDGSNAKWLIHIDADELIDGDLDEIRQQPSNVHTFWMQNEEAKFNKIPEKKDNCFAATKFYDCAKHPDKCVSYGNGKSGARVCEYTSANGPHRCKSSGVNAKEVKLERVKVKHFESCDFDSYKQKFQHLSKQDKSTDNIPFSYYKESIDAVKGGDDEKLAGVFTKYRVETD
jgi:hypothetical protein